MTKRWWVLEPRAKGLIRKIETLGKAIKVGTTMKISTIGLGIAKRVGTKMVIESRKMIKKTKVVFTFHQEL